MKNAKNSESALGVKTRKKLKLSGRLASVVNILNDDQVELLPKWGKAHSTFEKKGSREENVVNSRLRNSITNPGSCLTRSDRKRKKKIEKVAAATSDLGAISLNRRLKI